MVVFFKDLLSLVLKLISVAPKNNHALKFCALYSIRNCQNVVFIITS